MKNTNESSVINFSNKEKKKKEDQRLSKASSFYTEDVSKLIQIHKKEWRGHGRGELCDPEKGKTWSKDIFYQHEKVTPLEMIQHQIKESYECTSTFSSLAYQGQFVPFYIPKENGTIHSLKKGSRDNRPEMAIVVRPCPSKILVESFLPESMRKIVPSQSNYYNDAESTFDFKSEEDKNLEYLRKAGLDKRIKVAFVFVVPYNPSVAWKNKTPPPEQAQHFCSYFKFVMSCFTRARMVITFNLWSTKMVAAKGNADQIDYVSEIPEFGESMDKINIYPLGVSNKNFRNMTLVLWRLPHSIMWEGSFKKHGYPKFKVLFYKTVLEMNKNVHLDHQKKRNAFSMMGFSKSKSCLTKDVDMEDKDKANITNDNNQDENISLFDHRNTLRKPIEISDIWKHLETLGLSSKDKMFSPIPGWEPTVYSHKDWKIPTSYSTYAPGDLFRCECPMCGGSSEWCAQPTNLDELKKNGLNGKSNQKIPCPYCCCKHGHRKRMNQCVGTGRFGPTFVGCVGWHIHAIDKNARSLIKVYFEWKNKYNVHYEKLGTRIPYEINPKFHLSKIIFRCPLEYLKFVIPREGSTEPNKGEYKWLDTTTELDKDLIENIKFPTLEQLCVEKIRRMACLDQYLKDKTHQQLHYNAAKNIPKELLFKWFSVCPKDTIMDNTTKYIWGNRCCARCTQDYVPPAMT